MKRRFLDIPSLDGMRAGSILLVFAAHSGFENVISGGLGVTVFFVLSGYLITTLLDAEWERTATVSMRDFYLRRTFRILPLVYLVLALVAALTLVGWIGVGDVSVAGTLSQFLHFGNYFAILRPDVHLMDGTGVYWSLAVEEHFYVVLPIVFVLTRRAGWDGRRQAVAFAWASAAVLAWRCVLVYRFDVSTVRTYQATDTRIDALLIGCIAALFDNPARPTDTTGNRRRDAWAAAMGFVLILASLAIRDPGFRETLRYTVQALAVVAIMRFVVRYPSSLLGAVLNVRPVVWLGRLSYAFYLVHHVILIEMERRGVGQGARFALALPLSAGIAWALHRLVDSRAFAVRDRLMARRTGHVESPALVGSGAPDPAGMGVRPR